MSPFFYLLTIQSLSYQLHLQFEFKVRNEESHRSPGSLAVEISNREKEYEALKSKKNPSQAEKEKREELKLKIGGLKGFKKWLEPLPFDGVSAALKKLSDRVREQFVY